MAECTEDKTIKKDCADTLRKIPVLRYPKDPVVYIEDLYKTYPQGGEYGWYSFVMSAGTFAYWEVHGREWKLLSAGDLQTILGADIENMKEGDIPVWDEAKGKFEIVNLSVLGTEDY